LVDREIESLTLATYEQAVKIACLPDLIRGYEQVKMKNVDKFREAVRAASPKNVDRAKK
jgi:indolepyruvate ferredoxin oxidoreductase